MLRCQKPSRPCERWTEVVRAHQSSYLGRVHRLCNSLGLDGSKGSGFTPTLQSCTAISAVLLCVHQVVTHNSMTQVNLSHKCFNSNLLVRPLVHYGNRGNQPTIIFQKGCCANELMSYDLLSTDTCDKKKLSAFTHYDTQQASCKMLAIHVMHRQLKGAFMLLPSDIVQSNCSAFSFVQHDWHCSARLTQHPNIAITGVPRQKAEQEGTNTAYT